MIKFNKKLSGHNPRKDKENPYKGFYRGEDDNLAENEVVFDIEESERLSKRTSAETLFERMQEGYKPDLRALDWLEGFDESSRDLSEMIRQSLHSDNPDEVLRGASALVMIDAAMFHLWIDRRRIDFARELQRDSDEIIARLKITEGEEKAEEYSNYLMDLHSTVLDSPNEKIKKSEKHAEKIYKDFISIAELFVAGDKEPHRSSSEKTSNFLLMFCG